MTGEDFNTDGNLDLIVGVKGDEYAKLYLFDNDGKGNFKLKPSSK